MIKEIWEPVLGTRLAHVKGEELGLLRLAFFVFGGACRFSRSGDVPCVAVVAGHSSHYLANSTAQRSMSETHEKNINVGESRDQPLRA